MISSNLPKNLFKEKPIINFSPEINECPKCGSKLTIQKTTEKTVVTMDIGEFYSKEWVYKCSNDKSIFHSKKLRSLVPQDSTFGFDIMVYVGKGLYVRNRNIDEIRIELAEKNIRISDREISFLAKKFIVYLAIAHKGSHAGIRNLMNEKGGYIAHFDGTVEGDSPHLFTGLDELSGIVLDNIKLPSENQDELIPFFIRIKKAFGDPLALVHDMGTGILAAIAVVFPKVLDFICHSHFLRDAGKDLMEEIYGDIRESLKQYRLRPLLRKAGKSFEKEILSNKEIVKDIKNNLEKKNLIEASILKQVPSISAYALIHWALKKEGDGYGFPFDRPHFLIYKKLQDVQKALNEIIKSHPSKIRIIKPFYKIKGIIDKVLSDATLENKVLELEKRIEVFDKLREALHISPINGSKGLNDDGDEELDIKTIEKKVQSFRNWLVNDESLKDKKEYKGLVKQIDKYWEKLFADPIYVDTREGKIKIQPQRTNNILERFFRDLKRSYRKRSGTSNLSKALKAIIADTPLVRNLDNEEYMKILLNGCSTLEERFAQIDAKLVQEEIKKAQISKEIISPDMKKIINTPCLPEKISNSFSHF